MSELWGHFIGVIIVLMILTFIAIWFWAWRPRHKKQFRQLASLPMNDMEADEVNHTPERKS
ncbi:MAG: CcoQ/FixQ family Cbb3-type cytochrome c oxidase assembly chaperone [Spongiibacteraceae bacterium]|nr:CcoQ/FixQ family Cbb3-type cytochrome c oxidase assembly chaperone [Spongiibacteraceae bacterium]|tara:strand:+ start:1614 stop:1796 length:183 start_codon:yes stop_codon:yes gene_type:complete